MADLGSKANFLDWQFFIILSCTSLLIQIHIRNKRDFEIFGIQGGVHLPKVLFPYCLRNHTCSSCIEK